MSHGQDPTQQFLKSRIYFSKAPGSLATTSTKHYVSVRTPEESFQHEHFHGEMPKTSAYSKDENAADLVNIVTSETIGTWITVIGIIPGRFEEVVKYFSQFGEISKFEEGPGNYGYIEFAIANSAKIPIEKSQYEPIMVTKSYIVSVAQGRLKPFYVPKSNEHSEKITFDSPEINKYSKAQPSLFDTIKEAIFGE